MAKSIPNDIYQFSLLSAYNGGLKDGGPPVAFLTNHGTHGIGVFESDDDDNERPDDMIQVDGIAYSLDGDGDVDRADKADQMPFVMVTVFQATSRVKPPPGTGSKKVKELFERGRNTPMPFRITGEFRYINTQQQTLWDVQGTIFGFCVPAWQKSVSGDALQQSCFLSQDKKSGGRVLDFETGTEALLEWAKCGRFHLGFPQDDEFEQLRL